MILSKYKMALFDLLNFERQDKTNQFVLHLICKNGCGTRQNKFHGIGQKAQFLQLNKLEYNLLSRRTNIQKTKFSFSFSLLSRSFIIFALPPFLDIACPSSFIYSTFVLHSRIVVYRLIRLQLGGKVRKTCSRSSILEACKFFTC